MDRKPIGELLLQSGKLTPEKLNHALSMQRRIKGPLGELLVQLGFVSEEDVASAVAEQYACQFITSREITPEKVDQALLDKLTISFARKHDIVPLKVNDRNLLALANILDVEPIDQALRVLGTMPLVVTTRSAIQLLLEVLAYQNKDADQIAESTRVDISSGEINHLLGYILGRAVLAHASDIHIEPSGATSVVRFRVNGSLLPEISIPREHHDNLINVLFSRAGIEISDFMRFHDGRFGFEFAGRNLDLRFACSPTVEGPQAVVRILNDTRTQMRLGDLGFDTASMALMVEMTRRPYGLVIIVGPTGSGKTTTLYALLETLNSTRNKILTVEDPVEVRLPSIQQVQVNEKAGVTFASAIRAFLRQDPDIILVGEIRDEETAHETIRAANTGHLVLSTLHANSAGEAIPRLIDLGITPGQVANTLIGAVSQRFVRKLCPNCRLPSRTPRASSGSAAAGHSRVTFKAGPGCAQCQGGFKDRTIVAEILQSNADIRRLVHRQVSLDEILAQATVDGFRTMRAVAMDLVDQGVTSLEEVDRSLGAESPSPSPSPSPGPAPRGKSAAGKEKSA